MCIVHYKGCTESACSLRDALLGFASWCTGLIPGVLFDQLGVVGDEPMPHGPVHHLEQGGQGVHDGLGGGGEEQLRVLGRLGATQLRREQLAQAGQELVTVVPI